MRPTAATRVRFFEASKDKAGTRNLPPPSDKIVRDLGLENDTDARIEFTGKGKVIYAKRQKSEPADSRWEHWFHRPAIRSLAADAALMRLKYSVNKKIEKGVDPNEMNDRLAVIEKQIEESASVRAADLESLFDSMENAQRTHDARLKAEAEKEEQLRFDMAVKGAAQLVTKEAAGLIRNLPALAEAPLFRNEAVRAFQTFVRQSADPRNTNPPDYGLARAFAAQWADARPNATLGDPIARQLVDSLVKLVMQGCGMNARPADKQPLLRYKWADGKLSRPFGQHFGDPKPLGKGGNASAYIYSSGLDTVVVKKLNSGDKAQAEADVHAKAKNGDSNHIVDILGTAPDADGGLMLVLQHARKGDAMSIQQCIQSRLRAKTLDEKAAHHAFMTMFADMMKGVAQAHRNNVWHGDLKPENFFVEHKSGQLLLGDFGTSCDGLMQFMKSPVDSPDFSSPALVKSVISKKPGLFTYKDDTWSMGVILYEFKSPRFPGSEPGTEPKRLRPFPYGNFTFEAHNLIHTFTAHDNEHDRFAQLDLREENDLHRLIIQMLDPDPLKRPSDEAVLAHPLIAPYANPSTKEQKEIVRRARNLILEPQESQLLIG